MIFPIATQKEDGEPFRFFIDISCEGDDSGDFSNTIFWVKRATLNWFDFSYQTVKWYIYLKAVLLEI